MFECAARLTPAGHWDFQRAVGAAWGLTLAREPGHRCMDLWLKVIGGLEVNGSYVNQYPFCEPRLGR